MARLERVQHEPVKPNNRLERVEYTQLERSVAPPPSIPWETRPPRVVIVNTDTTEEYECQYNPTEVTRQLEVVYNVIQADGLGYTPLQYRNTNAQAISLAFDLQAISDNVQKMADALRFFESLCYPTQSESGLGSSPPPILVVWPNWISMTCVVQRWKESITRFKTADMRPMLGRIELEVMEARATAIYSQDVRFFGARR